MGDGAANTSSSSTFEVIHEVIVCFGGRGEENRSDHDGLGLINSNKKMIPCSVLLSLRRTRRNLAGPDLNFSFILDDA